MNRDDLQKLSKADLIELVLKIQRSGKTSRTSSRPPSLDKKARRESARPGGAKPGHKGHFRTLADAPGETIDHLPDTCPHCQTRLDARLCGEVTGEYDEIDLPVFTPVVRRHRRLAVICPGCRKRVNAPLPNVAHGSPFGPRLHALVVYLKTFQLVSFSRLERMFGDVFGLAISQGALANMLRRSHRPFAEKKRQITRRLRQAGMVACDETGIRIEGLNGYHWVFLSDREVVHEPRLSRAARACPGPDPGWCAM